MTDKTPATVLIKDADIKMFNFIARFGFATMEQINTYLGTNSNTLKVRLSTMVKHGYLINHRIFYAKPSVYTITKKANLTDLAIVKQIDLSDYCHDLLVLDVFLKIRDNFADYTTEKMIRAERGVGLGKSGRIPDLVGYTHEGKCVAVEVDRSAKSYERLQRIIDDYRMSFDYNEVWFYVRNQFIFNRLTKVIDDSRKFRVNMLDEVLSPGLPGIST